MGGTIVKKFYFDLELIYNILLAKAKYAMLGYYKKYKNKVIISIMINLRTSILIA